jgi:hypothetical protein
MNVIKGGISPLLIFKKKGGGPQIKKEKLKKVKRKQKKTQK